MPLGHGLSESGKESRYVYFSITAIVSTLYVMRDGSSAEIAVIGNDGIIGAALFMGGKPCATGPSYKAPATPTGCPGSY